MNIILKNDWQQLLSEEFNQAYFKSLITFLSMQEDLVFPEEKDIFSALNETSYENTKVVILGQDPYHGLGQAHGLSFSVQKGEKLPPSLKNIFKELEADLGFAQPSHGFLQSWAKEGVLLLNTVLTVSEGKPNSHKGKGWEQLTDKIISLLNQRQKPVIFILWGKHAAEKRKIITNQQHLILEASHPSPLSANRGFFGSRPFSKTNQFLKSIGESEIDWKLS